MRHARVNFSVKTICCANVFGALVFGLALLISFTAHEALAQNTPGFTSTSAKVRAEVRAVDEDSLRAISGRKEFINLWGVEKVEAISPRQKLNARVELDNIINGQPVICDVKDIRGGQRYATCVNHAEKDIGLHMLQQGYVIANRGDIYGSNFERPYVDSEKQAQNTGIGVWQSEQKTGSSSLGEGAFYLGLGFVIFLVVLASFAFIAFTIMRGFRSVIAAQKDNMQMMARERKLREKERNIVAVMVDSELKSNKAKIEAYIVVYEEVMRGLSDPVKPPKYKKAGDIVQRHPSLDRAVFERNTDKLDILGPKLAGQLIKFYAQIKSTPDYVNVEPDMPVAEVKQMVSDSLKDANSLNEMAEKLLDALSSGGFNYDFDENDKVTNANKVA